MKINGKEYRTIWFENNVVKIIDQTKLPHQFIIKDLKKVKDAINAIKVMEVRGAPLIGGTAAYGIALAVQENNDPEFIRKSAEELIQSRPTAINLKWAVDRMISKLSGINSDQILDIALTEAKEICDEDEKFCENIGINGLKIIEEIYNKKKDTVNILTHCNAGWLATVDHGTALSPIFKLFDEGFDVHVWVDETRPRNQGLSLTAWELSQYKIRHTVVTDNAGGLLMKEGLVDFVIVGADRVALDGQVCNKIGTYLKAIAAKENKIPFYVAAPISTIDINFFGDSRNFEIECRDSNEIMTMRGQDKSGSIVEVRLGSSPAYNPAFDVTPPGYITKFICEKGVFDTDEIRNIEGL